MLETTTNRLRQFHDALIGLLAGGGAGAILGLLISVRLNDNPLFIWTGAAFGAALGINALRRSHRVRGRFITPTVVLSWVVLAASILFIAALVSAIANFN